MNKRPFKTGRIRLRKLQDSRKGPRKKKNTKGRKESDKREIDAEGLEALTYSDAVKRKARKKKHHQKRGGRRFCAVRGRSGRIYIMRNVQLLIRGWQHQTDMKGRG